MNTIIWDTRLKVITGMIITAALFRLAPHPYNFTPIGAMALFGGCYVSNKRLAFIIPLGAMLMSDILLQLLHSTGLQAFALTSGFHPGMIWVYGSFALITCLGFLLRGREQRQTIMVASLVGSILFFIITNFGQWATGYYGYTGDALTKSFIMGIPFFSGTLMGDLFYNLALFGSFALARWKFPVLAKQS